MNITHLYTVDVVDDKYIYKNPYGVVFCNHDYKWIKVPTCWGHISYICYNCGKLVKRELASNI